MVWEVAGWCATEKAVTWHRLTWGGATRGQSSVWRSTLYTRKSLCRMSAKTPAGSSLPLQMPQVPSVVAYGWCIVGLLYLPCGSSAQRANVPLHNKPHRRTSCRESVCPAVRKWAAIGGGREAVVMAPWSEKGPLTTAQLEKVRVFYFCTAMLNFLQVAQGGTHSSFPLPILTTSLCGRLRDSGWPKQWHCQGIRHPGPLHFKRLHTPPQAASKWHLL